EIVANLATALGHFLNFALELYALNQAETEALWARGWAALGKAAAAQSRQLAESEPARRFLGLLMQAIASGRAHVARPDGREPNCAEAWGWRRTPSAPGDSATEEWHQ